MSEQDFWRNCAAVEIEDGADPKLGGRPTVGPCRLAAQDIADRSDDGLSAEQIVADFPGTPIDKVRAVLSYYRARQPELTPSR